jgi:hypothetical protein
MRQAAAFAWSRLAYLLALVDEFARLDVLGPDDGLGDLIGPYLGVEAHEVDHLAADARNVEIGPCQTHDIETRDNNGDQVRPLLMPTR